MSKQKRNVVVFGGGNGSATTLRAMKRHRDIFNLSAIVTTSDSGGSSGRLREEFNTLPAGDILRAVMALSPIGYRTILRPYFYKRRLEGLGKIDGHNLGNLFLVLLAQYAGDFVTAIRALEQALDAKGKVYPATVVPGNLTAELKSGKVVKTEAALDRPDFSFEDKITKVWLEPSVQAYEPVIDVIEKADFILLSPGSLYTSIIPSILPVGIKEAIQNSHARLIYIAGNKYELDGEPGPTALHDFVNELEIYLPRKLNAIVFNSIELTSEQRNYYEEKKWGLIDFDPNKLRGYLVFDETFERQGGGLSAEQLGRILREAMT